MKFNRNYSIFILYNEKSEMLVQDRRSISKAGEDWGFFGGGVEPGESFEEALIREIREELDMDITHKFKLIGDTVFTLDGFGIQKTKIYITHLQQLGNVQWRVLEGDGAEFMSLGKLSTKKLAPWSHICIDMLKDYFGEL